MDPVELLPQDSPSQPPEPGMALCLSGGGYRAMLFHLGSFWRLYEANLLAGIERISSVSGGSITSAMVALQWSKLSFNPSGLRDDFVPYVVEPIRALARRTLDASSVFEGILLPGSAADRVAGEYRQHLYGVATLQDLPAAPRFVINASNVQSGVLWRFMKPYMRDYRVGEVRTPRVELADAVAASSAFPPVLSPMELDLDPSDFTPGSGQDLQREPFTDRVVLTDGGVYDNLGLETAYKRYRTILCSDGGGKLEPEEEPKRDWARHSYRVLNMIHEQVTALRKRQLIASYVADRRDGAYWGIRTDIANYGLADALPCPLERTAELALTPTRLKRMKSELQQRLINWGYAVCDAALRKHVQPDLPRGAFPYPESGV